MAVQNSYKLTLCFVDPFWIGLVEVSENGAYRAARDALAGWDPSGGAIYYFNPNTATGSWIWSRPLIVTIGGHMFCA